MGGIVVPTQTKMVTFRSNRKPGLFSPRESLQSQILAGHDTTGLVQLLKDQVEEYFPGAIPSQDVLDKVSRICQARGWHAKNCLYAQSVCPDEINHERGDVTHLFTNYLGEVFHLGGLGGIPFTGKSGFAAYSHHVPDGGNCFILMAPHVGVDSRCNLGSYDRAGQINAGAACGAAIGALGHCKASKELPDLTKSQDDYQMSYIIHRVNEAKDEILGDDPEDENAIQARLANHMHKVATEMLDNIATLNFGGPHSSLIILTGIQINMPDPLPDYFQPRAFYVKQKTGEAYMDLFEETFGTSKP